MSRASAEPGDTFLQILERGIEKFAIPDLSTLKVANSANEPGRLAAEFGSATVSDLGLNNGDMLFLTYGEAQPQKIAQKVSGETSIAISLAVPEIATPVTKSLESQLAVDNELDLQSGYIKREKSGLCKHGDKGMCEYCSPLPPWDSEYLNEKKIKHKSFHAHIKELNELQNNSASGSSYIPPLEEPTFKINLNCPLGHLPYPKGICSKCQPAPITLQQQDFRMVDHLEFADHSILNKFIDLWRRSGTQRFGILYGRYEQYDQVPLGIKATVEVIYEPPQGDETDGITLLDWDNQAQVDKIAEGLGLQQVGAVFTDLTDAGNGSGAVLCKRHKESYFLLCIEVLMAARNQSAHMNVTNHARNRTFSSKYITCVVTGNTKGEIEPRAYQVSATAEALVKADFISPSTQPSQLYINETSGVRYVPDIFYLKINEYKLQVKTNAKPAFPVDYLLVTLLDSFPVEPQPHFRLEFPIENREFLGELQDPNAVHRQLVSGSGDGSRLVDFHFLVYLAKMAVLGDAELEVLLRYAKEKNDEDYVRLTSSDSWQTLLTVIEHSI